MRLRHWLAGALLLWLAAAQAAAQGRCGSARDLLVRVREQLRPGISRPELEDALQLLKRAADLCPSLGDAWYYRHLCEKQLGNARNADYALSKAKAFGSEVLRQGDDPTRAPAPAETETVSPFVREKWALVVGIGRFRDRRIPPLKFTVNDARDFAALLGNRDYGRFKAENVRLLADEEATTVRIKSELNWVARNAARDDLVVLYLSSHGSPREMDTAGVSYVVTHDTDISSPDQLYATSLPMIDIADAVRMRFQARRVVVFLDTCYSGAAVPGARQLVVEGLGISEDAVSRIRQGAGRVVITSSQANERSWESEELKNGFFTHYLIRGLMQDRGLLPIEQVFNFLKDQVSRRVRQEKGVSQTPTLAKSERAAEIAIGVETRSP